MIRKAAARHSMMMARCVFAAAFVLAASASLGCASLVAGSQDTEADFLVTPHPDGAFAGWTEITVDHDVNEASKGTLQAITLDVATPAGYPDLAFLASLQGQAVTPTQRVDVANCDSFPAGHQAVAMNVTYKDDLRPFFPDGHTIRIEWAGRTNPSFTSWPDGGFWIRARIKVDVE